MNLPTHIQARVKQEAEVYAHKRWGDEPQYSDAKERDIRTCISFASRLFEILSEQGSEFDAKAGAEEKGFNIALRISKTKAVSPNDYVGLQTNSFVEGARWQFENDRARIGLAEARAWHPGPESIAQHHRELVERCKELEARLNNRNMECPECGFNMVSIDVSKLMDKLAELQKACEAERIEREKQINELKARVKELEAELLQRRESK